MTRACGSCIGKINFACLTRLSLVAAVLLGMTACNLPPSGNPPVTVPGYRLVADIQLPGDGSRFDYESLDVASHRLYIAQLGASEVVVFDTASGKVLHVVSNIAGVHGVIVAPNSIVFMQLPPTRIRLSCLVRHPFRSSPPCPRDAIRTVSPIQGPAARSTSRMSRGRARR